MQGINDEVEVIDLSCYQAGAKYGMIEDTREKQTETNNMGVRKINFTTYVRLQINTDVISLNAITRNIQRIKQ